MIIKTEKFQVRRIFDEDIDSLLAVYQDSKNMKFIPNSVSNWNKKKLSKKYERINCDYENGFGIFVVELLEGKIIGEAGLFNSFNELNHLELEYIIDQGYWGKGYGKDANSSEINSMVAKDAMGFSLNYFDKDYVKINSSINNPISNKLSIKDLSSKAPQLYNGNISAMVTTLFDKRLEAFSPQLSAYKYDQLNRIAAMETYGELNMNSNEWNAGYIGTNKKYNTTYTYDANGNIHTLQRNDYSGIKLDELAYNDNDANGRLLNNQLVSVSDAEITDYKDDFEDSSKYEYDTIGNLIKDDGEEIENIEWTVSGKVKSITRDTYPIKPDLEFSYDAMGNRISKTIKPRNGYSLDGTSVTTYYVRDASGNVMATYKISRDARSNVTAKELSEFNIFGSSLCWCANPFAFHLNTPPLVREPIAI